MCFFKVTFFFEKKSHRKKVFRILFLFFIISHAQPMRVASRNSLCAARGRGKRYPENR